MSTVTAPRPRGRETRLSRLGDRTAAMLTGLWAQHEQGRYSLEDFTELAVIIVATANGQAASLARLSVAAYITAMTGRTLPAITTEPPPYRTDPARIRRALETIVATEAITGRLSRLGHAEPVDTAADTTARIISYWDTDLIDGWERVTESDPCDLCQWWAAESHKFPPHAKMPRHKGCLCSQVPTFTNQIPTERTA